MSEIIDITGKTEASFGETNNKFAKEFLLNALNDDCTNKDFERLLSNLIKDKSNQENWRYINDEENNQGRIDIAIDPGKSLMERVTNAIDASLDLIAFEKGAHDDPTKHNIPSSPGEAGEMWLGLDKNTGLSGINSRERRKLAKKYCNVKIYPGDGPNNRIVTIKDKGIGIAQKEFQKNILALGASSKIRKYYLMGHYGQGGSSTFGQTQMATLIVSKKFNSDHISFTVVWYDDREKEKDVKVGCYKYLVEDKLPFALNSKSLDIPDFNHGTIIKHFGYQLDKYRGVAGNGSFYQLLERVLFNPVIPIDYTYKLNPDSKVQHRTIKGARAALLGAEDEEDKRTKIEIEHQEKRLAINISNGELGKIWVEYWLTKQPKRKQDKNGRFFTPDNPINGKLDQYKPIIFTNNGQTQHEESANFTAKELELPFLKNRLVIHIDCSDLTVKGKQGLFNANREQLKDLLVKKEILSKISEYIKADQKLIILNDEAAQSQAKEETSESQQKMLKLVMKFLTLNQGTIKSIRGEGSGSGTHLGNLSPRNQSTKRIIKKEIKLSDPPTYIRLVWDEDKDIKFYNTRERWIGIETDAYSALQEDHIKISSDDDLEILNTSELANGRFKIHLRCKETSKIGNTGSIKVKLKIDEQGIDLGDTRNYIVTEVPKESKPKINNIPPIRTIPVDGKNDPDHDWAVLFDHTEDCNKYEEEDVAFRWLFSNGELLVYFNTKYANYVDAIKQCQKNGGMAKVEELKTKYKVFLMGLSYLDFNEEENNKYKVDYESSIGLERKESEIKRKNNFSIAGASLLHINNEIFNRGQN